MPHGAPFGSHPPASRRVSNSPAAHVPLSHRSTRGSETAAARAASCGCRWPPRPLWVGGHVRACSACPVCEAIGLTGRRLSREHEASSLAAAGVGSSRVMGRVSGPSARRPHAAAPMRRLPGAAGPSGSCGTVPRAQQARGATDQLQGPRWRARRALASAHCLRSAAAKQQARARCEAVRCIGRLGVSSLLLEHHFRP
jgi:hypothetical protein